MRRFLFIVLLASIALPFPAFAESTLAQAERVQIVTDQQAGAVRIVIDGEDAAIIDATGLHVREGISQGGSLTDYGRAGFDAHAAGLKGEARAE